MAKVATTSIFIDKYHPKADGKCAVSIRITYNRKKRYYPTKYKLTPDEFEVMNNRPPKNVTKSTFKKAYFKTMLIVLMAEENKAIEIISELKAGFTWTLFERRFVRKNGDNENLFALLEERAMELRSEDRISTAVTFECTLSSLKKFYKKERLTLDEISVTFLKNYRKWMSEDGNSNGNKEKIRNEAKGNSNATIGMYLRNVRYIFLRAIDDKLVPEELYPFGSGSDKFTIPTGRNLKKALPTNEVADIINYIPKNESESKARDLWLFSFYGGGINIKDIALLKFKNINDEVIRFERAKTKRENEDKPVVITFVITPEIQRIISRWGNKSINPNDYLFPILRNNSTPEEIYKLVQQITRFINDHMNNVRISLGIKSRVTTYVGRHSVSTFLRNSGISIAEISEGLGHRSIKTTQNYLASFEISSKKKIGNILSNITNNNNLKAV